MKKTPMSDSPISRYQRHLDDGTLLPDAAQLEAVKHLQRLFDQLQSREVQRQSAGRLRRWFDQLWGRAPAAPVQGVYFWGGVGRGKTCLMDIFYDCLPFERKMRTHFHRFMRRVHGELRQLKHTSDPLNTVADKLAQEAVVICFDEFFVVDITDAMILANLFRALFSRGVTLVATSNVPPDDLYRDGLQRARFLPAIALLKQYTQVINVDGGVDYRLRTLEQAPLYHWPANEAAEAALRQCFDSLIPDANNVELDVMLDVESRAIRARRVADDVVWFDFADICDGPRSQNDYIVLAREYHAVLVSGVPELGEPFDDRARRFIYMVDEFYDRGVKLIVSAERPIEELYRGGRLSFEFERTVSRLLEMQSQDYLASAHKA